jgi:hypothetical protein
MMDITAFIRELLFSHDCVIVPGFGGFIGNYTPARIDKTTSTFYPPVKQISFNRNLNNNDGLLIGRISESAGMNYGDSRTMVEEFVTGVRKKLERGEKVVFDNIGTFSASQEGTIQFEPDSTVNYHLDSWGLEPFSFKPVEGYDVRSRITKHIDRQPVGHPSMRKVLWRAAVIVPLLAVVVAVSLKSDLFKSRVETTTLNPLASAEFENNKAAVESASTAPVKVVIPVVSPASSDVTPAQQETGTFCIITGSFRSKENAEVHAATLKKEGFNPEILEAPNGFYRVSIMKCTSLPSALDQKGKLVKEFPGSWVKKF